VLLLLRHVRAREGKVGHRGHGIAAQGLRHARGGVRVGHRRHAILVIAVAGVGSHRIRHAARLLHLQLRSSELVAVRAARKSGLCERGALLLPFLCIGFSLELEHARALRR
jgi:hypothetical protein